MAVLNELTQIAAVTWLNIRNIPRRPASSIVSVIGIAGVVAVFVAVLSISAGFKATLATTGAEDVAIVLRNGANAELSSGLSEEAVRIIADAPGIMSDAQGPLVSDELFVIIDVPKRTTGTTANVPLRGVLPAAFRVRPHLKIVAGRAFTPGLNEIVVGRGASQQFTGLSLGSTRKWGPNTWKVVGIFADGGSVAESEIWCDVKVLQGAYHRGNTYQSVRARLQSPAAFQTFKDALTTDPRLNVSVQRESDFYAEQSAGLTALINTVGTLVAALMGIGAVFGAILTMYTAVSARAREIATLRALGFSGAPVVISVLAEALLLGLAGGILGGAVAYLGFNGYQTSTLNFQSFSQVTFAFAVTPALLKEGIAYALLMGLIGGLLPSIRAARLPITGALREL